MKQILFFMLLIPIISLSCSRLDMSIKNTALINAAKEGSISVVQTLLDQGVSPNIRDDDGVPALMWAAENGHAEIVRLLLDNGADVNAKKRKDGTTVLMETSEEGHTEIVRLLLDKGAKVNEKRSTDGITALMEASDKCHTEIVRLLLDRGAEVNAQMTKDGTTALMEASDEGCTDIVRLLLDRGAEVNAQMTKDGTTALMEASEGGHTEIVSLLLDKGADANIKAIINNVEWTALKAANKERNREIVEMLERAGTAGIGDTETAQYDQIALSAIRLLTNAQETYYVMEATFSDSLQELKDNSEMEGVVLEISPGVTVTIEQADDDGYVMKTSHENGRKIYMSRFSFSENIHDAGNPEVSEIEGEKVNVLKGMMDNYK